MNASEDMSQELKAWAEAYIRVHEDRATLEKTHPDHAAAYRFMGELAGQDAENCWQGILAVVSMKPSDWVLGMLACGPVEDLLNYSGVKFIKRVEAQAASDDSFRQMLHEVLECGDSKVWKRLVKARGVDSCL